MNMLIKLKVDFSTRLKFTYRTLADLAIKKLFLCFLRSLDVWKNTLLNFYINFTLQIICKVI